MKKILVVEDDKTLKTTISLALESESYSVISAEDGAMGYELARTEDVDLITLDIGLPSMNGMDICRSLRSDGISTPIIMFTGEKKEEIDKVLGLEIGADDYVVKPFGTKELIARIRAVLRGYKPEKQSLDVCVFNDAQIDFKKQTAKKGGKDIHLTAKEFDLLRFLITHEGEVINRETLLNEVWGYENYPSTRTVDTFIHNLRKKFENDPSKPSHIVTVHWSGYKFVK